MCLSGYVALSLRVCISRYNFFVNVVCENAIRRRMLQNPQLVFKDTNSLVVNVKNNIIKFIMNTKDAIELEKVTIRFSGDSGDGMQLTGTLFSNASALLGNDLATFPDFPSEIRAPQGTVSGVSGFQVHFGQSKIYTPGDYADVLVAMNPAALKANLKWVKNNGTIILDIDSFDDKNLRRAGYESNPLDDESLKSYNIIEAPISNQTKLALADTGMSNKEMLRSKNMFALGITGWIYNRPFDSFAKLFESKFAKKPELVNANKKVLREGYLFAENTHQLSRYTIKPAEIEKGIYRNISGNVATAWGFLAAAENSGLELFLGSYPITPASDILHELAKRKEFKVKTFQAEDEIAGICTAIGASFGGKLAITTTSGPGLALKGEAIGLAVMTELPIVVVDVQRGGPSTGLPTKTEQADLMQALYGRNGEAPCIVIAASTPSNCYEYAYMASKLAVEHMTPVILLTDGFLANGSEPWKIVKTEDLPPIVPRIVMKAEGDNTPYIRDEETLARNWVIPGTPELMHRIGGLEKDSVTGSPSHDFDNHQYMCELREEKVQRVANYVPELEIDGDKSGDLLVVGWGGTYGHLYNAVESLQKEGKKVGLAHFNYIKPLPKNTKEVFKGFNKIIVCELNLGQFANYLRMTCPEFVFSQYNKVKGLPFTDNELIEEFKKYLEA